MPTNLENLQTAKSLLVTKLAELYSNPKPSYSIDGQSVSHSEFRKSLLEELRLLDDEIKKEGAHETDTAAINTPYDNTWRDGYRRSGLLNFDEDRT